MFTIIEIFYVFVFLKYSNQTIKYFLLFSNEKMDGTIAINPTILFFLLLTTLILIFRVRHKTI